MWAGLVLETVSTYHLAAYSATLELQGIQFSAGVILQK